MSYSLTRGIQALRKPDMQNAVTVDAVYGGYVPMLGRSVGTEQAKRLSTVYACVEILSNSIGKLPIHVIDKQKREVLRNHPLEWMLNIRPNEAMTPFVAKKMLEANRLCYGNGVAWILRDYARRPIGYLPIPPELVSIFRDASGQVLYHIVLPSGEPITLPRDEVIHRMGPTTNGWLGRSVLSYAADVIAGASAAQEYNKNYYINGGQPAGVLQTDADLTKMVPVKQADGTTKDVKLKDLMRESWEAVHSGPTNAQKIAILDYGLKYTPISVSNRDAQFVEQHSLSVEDIARFFNMPLYKLSAGKQSYNSNEQNAIEYVTGTLHPIVSQDEEEYGYKLLTVLDLHNGLALRVDMNEELRGDFAARSTYYERMRNIGGYSVNDIRRSELLPDVPGGDEYRESLNYVPLDLWRDLSIIRNSKGGKSK